MCKPATAKSCTPVSDRPALSTSLRTGTVIRMGPFLVRIESREPTFMDVFDRAYARFPRQPGNSVAHFRVAVQRPFPQVL